MWADAKTSEMFHSTSNMAEILGILQFTNTDNIYLLLNRSFMFII